jgi:sugar lactone lactonase YvrE
VTRSGSRGQQLPVTLFRLSTEGELEEISGDIMNPTGVAFDSSGQLFVTSRAEGTVYRVSLSDEAVSFASDLGIATGIAFSKRDEMFVGDRSGTIYQINGIGETSVYATLEQSIAAYHLAFGTDNNLYITRPNVASYDSIMCVDSDGEVSTFYRGLGRPQGLAFDQDGNLYVAACLGARRGIIKINNNKEASISVAGMNIVGLCFGANGEMFIATNEAIFSLPLGIDGILL